MAFFVSKELIDQCILKYADNDRLIVGASAMFYGAFYLTKGGIVVLVSPSQVILVVFHGLKETKDQGIVFIRKEIESIIVHRRILSVDIRLVVKGKKIKLSIPKMGSDNQKAAIEMFYKMRTNK